MQVPVQAARLEDIGLFVQGRTHAFASQTTASAAPTHDQGGPGPSGRPPDATPYVTFQGEDTPLGSPQAVRWQQQPEQPPPDEQEMAKRRKRRENWQKDKAVKLRWDLKRRLVDISADVEFVAREVLRIQTEWQSTPIPSSALELSHAERAQLQQNHLRRLADIVPRQCSNVLKGLMSHKWGWLFNMPVDTKTFSDYLNTVKVPMDFGTIKARIEAGHYANPHQWLEDMKLVFLNARTYNAPGSDVNVMATTLQERFEERWASLIMPKLAEEENTSRAEEQAARRRHLDLAHAKATEALDAHCGVLVRYINELQQVTLEAKSVAAAACTLVTREEKEEIIDRIRSLPQLYYDMAMSLVVAQYPGLHVQAAETVHLDLDTLDALALRQLASFTASCAKAAQQAEAAGTDGQPDAGPCVEWPGLLVGAGLKGLRSHKRAGEPALQSSQPSHDGFKVPAPPARLESGITSAGEQAGCARQPIALDRMLTAQASTTGITAGVSERAADAAMHEGWPQPQLPDEIQAQEGQAANGAPPAEPAAACAGAGVQQNAQDDAGAEGQGDSPDEDASAPMREEKWEGLVDYGYGDDDDDD